MPRDLLILTAIALASASAAFLASFLAARRSRGCGVLSTFAGLFGTIFGAIGLLGAIGSTYRDDRPPWAFALSIPLVGIATMLVGGRIQRLSPERGSETAAGLIADRFGGSAALRLLIAFIGLAFAVPVVALQLQFAGAFWDRLVPGSPFPGVVAIAGLASAFVVSRGLRGLTRAQVCFAAIFLGGVVAASLFLTKEIGGARRMVSVLIKGTKSASAEPLVARDLVSNGLAYVLMIAATVLQPGVWLRLVHADDERTVRRAGRLVAIVPFFFLAIPITAIGLGARVVYPPTVDSQWRALPDARVGTSARDFDRVFETFAADRVLKDFGPWGASILLAGVVAASLGASVANAQAFGAIVARDVTSRLKPRGREIVGRFFALLLVAFCGWIAVASRSDNQIQPIVPILELALLALPLLVQLLPVAFAAVFLGRGSHFGACAGILVGMTVILLSSAALQIVVGRLAPGIATRLDRLHSLGNPLLVAFAANLFIFAWFSLLKTSFAPRSIHETISKTEQPVSR